MEDIFPKFIIEDGRLIIGRVTFHKELAIDKTKVTGGGWFRWNKEKTMIIFYEKSEDFGRATLEDIKKAVLSKQVYSSPYSDDSIADQFKFGYDTGTEILELSSSI